MYHGKSLRVLRLADGIVELCFDREGEAVNKFDCRTVDELAAAVAAIRGAADVRGVHLIEGAGHWVQSEAADEVSRRLVAFARDVLGAPG